MNTSAPTATPIPANTSNAAAIDNPGISAGSNAHGSNAHGSNGSPKAVEKNFSPLVRQFLDYLRLEKPFSDYTVKSYGADLIQFGQFLAGEIGASHAAQPRSGA